MNYCLVDFPVLTEGKVESFKACDSICRKFHEMGIRKNAPIQRMGRLPFSRNIYVIVGSESFVLREDEARCLEVSCRSL